MLKLVKVGCCWFMVYEGTLYSRDAPVEDVKKWSKVTTLLKSDFDGLAPEFPPVRRQFKRVSDGTYALGATTAAMQVREVGPVHPHPTTPYGAYHLMTAIKKRPRA